MQFARGQVWQYHTRPDETASRLLINRIENEPDLGEIFHISVRAVRVKNPRVATGISTSLPHFPVSRAALEQSVTRLDGIAAPNAAYLSGYANWRMALAAGTAGVFSIPVAEIVAMVENTVATTP